MEMFLFNVISTAITISCYTIWDIVPYTFFAILTPQQGMPDADADTR